MQVNTFGKLELIFGYITFCLQPTICFLVELCMQLRQRSSVYKTVVSVMYLIHKTVVSFLYIIYKTVVSFLYLIYKTVV